MVHFGIEFLANIQYWFVNAQARGTANEIKRLNSSNNRSLEAQGAVAQRTDYDLHIQVTINWKEASLMISSSLPQSNTEPTALTSYAAAMLFLP